MSSLSGYAGLMQDSAAKSATAVPGAILLEDPSGNVIELFEFKKDESLR